MKTTDTKLKGKLERLVLIAVRNIQRHKDKYVTAKEITEYINLHYEKDYLQQTISTVLKRLVKKNKVQIINYGSNRRGYFDHKLRQGEEGELVWEKIIEIADEFFFGDLDNAIEGIIKEKKKRETLLAQKDDKF